MKIILPVFLESSVWLTFDVLILILTEGIYIIGKDLSNVTIFYGQYSWLLIPPHLHCLCLSLFRLRRERTEGILLSHISLKLNGRSLF